MEEKIIRLLTKAVSIQASDLHLTIGMPPVFRINGDLVKMDSDKILPNMMQEMTEALLPSSHMYILKDKGEVDFSYGIPKVSRFRINAYYQRSHISLAIRVIPTSIPTLEELQMPQILTKISEKKQGLVLVTGPTGSGKSTTLASMLKHINDTQKKHIITLEDPIEYLHKHGNSIIDQREVGNDTKSFANGLRASLRQDPDVILVGEMRDLETIATAITAAETGHLVFATLHTSSAPATIDRIIDVFPPGQQAQIRIQLASVLTAIVSQRLFPTANRQGRRAATEILINNPAISNMIRGEKIHQIHNVMQTSKKEGMNTLAMSIQELLNRKEVSHEEVYPYLQERNA
ncbi:type IV pili twitching motility protein PilT [Salipaludibacillus keqinensis]|uniref:Type IV pili twitching motility protein PilT n=1 Tax=Salipaludibacillus keqinensis TaxID=2045207 RepID=A0A323TVS9_9BACI|nr:type IV pilus twitching motility protein PilT [Salipaludibacillus keqinensis]PYZ93635.1 type IV pili twitching motility protein PilT [Salipaludibacillus keqinensis]